MNPWESSPHCFDTLQDYTGIGAPLVFNALMIFWKPVLYYLMEDFHSNYVELFYQKDAGDNSFYLRLWL